MESDLVAKHRRRRQRPLLDGRERRARAVCPIDVAKDLDAAGVVALDARHPQDRQVTEAVEIHLWCSVRQAHRIHHQVPLLTGHTPTEHDAEEEHAERRRDGFVVLDVEIPISDFRFK